MAHIRTHTHTLTQTCMMVNFENVFVVLPTATILVSIWQKRECNVCPPHHWIRRAQLCFGKSPHPTLSPTNTPLNCIAIYFQKSSIAINTMTVYKILTLKWLIVSSCSKFYVLFCAVNTADFRFITLITQKRFKYAL